MKSLINVILFISISGAAFGQTKTNFSGSWALNLDKTDQGGAPVWVLPTKFAIAQSANSIVISRTLTDDQHSQNSYTDTLLFDESAVTTIVAFLHSKKISRLKWATDGKRFVIESTSIDSSGEYGSKTTETWSLLDDGKTLIDQRRIVQTNGMDYIINAYYDKK